jgi:hypothetical protein
MKLSERRLLSAQNPRRFKAKRRKDALALAELIYDVYKEEECARVYNGQNATNKHSRKA